MVSTIVSFQLQAIELANSLLGFNGWSCHIVEMCCEEQHAPQPGSETSMVRSAFVSCRFHDFLPDTQILFGRACAIISAAAKSESPLEMGKLLMVQG